MGGGKNKKDGWMRLPCGGKILIVYDVHLLIVGLLVPVSCRCRRIEVLSVVIVYLGPPSYFS